MLIPRVARVPVPFLNCPLEPLRLANLVVANGFPVCCARPTCRASDAARPLPRLIEYPEGANCSGRDAVALADSEARERRVGRGRVPAPLES